MPDAMIELDRLTKAFGSHTVVDQLSFTVPRGEVLGFLGPNGAGKSTTMKMLTGFLNTTAGTARVAGFDIQKNPVEVKSRVGYLPEGAPVWPDMTPNGFLSFIASVRGFSGQDTLNAVDRAADSANLKSVMNQPIGTLSKGFKRRVGLAQALLHDPDVLILDEPTDGLDPNQKQEVRNLIRGIAAEKAIVISTHILEEVEAVCSRAIIIAKGRIVADATPEALEARSPRHNGVRLEFHGSHEAARNALAGVAGISSIEAEPGDALFCYAKDGAPIAGPISDALLSAGIQIHDIRTERGRLDDVFRTITADDNGHASIRESSHE